jgi:gluconate:H+ symporter, GntP family
LPDLSAQKRAVVPMLFTSVPALAALPAADAPKAGTGQLIIAALLGIAVVVVLITVVKMHPFLALILGSAVLGLAAALGASDTIDASPRASAAP